jgi:probable F420-dependent oxidoreductase
VRLACLVFPTESTPSVATLAKMAEERGFDALFLPDHTHIPVSRETPFPNGPELPDHYKRTPDPLVALAAAAGATERLLLGICVCLVIERDPIITAKQVATLDQVSDGRVLFGVGAGWNVEEMRNHGVAPEGRWRRMREYVEAMQSIWTEDEASYDGKYVSFEPIWCWPKPRQKPYPPVLIGGNGPTVEDRVVNFGDIWMPNVLDEDDGELVARIARFQERTAAEGRNITVTLNGAPTRPDRLTRYAEVGVERANFYLPSGDRPAIEKRMELILERTAALR